MKKLKMTVGKLTFEEGCNKYLEYCRQRNLREGTIRHYRQSYLHFYTAIPLQNNGSLTAVMSWPSQSSSDIQALISHKIISTCW